MSNVYAVTFRTDELFYLRPRIDTSYTQERDLTTGLPLRFESITVYANEGMY